MPHRDKQEARRRHLCCVYLTYLLRQEKTRADEIVYIRQVGLSSAVSLTLCFSHFDSLYSR